MSQFAGKLSLLIAGIFILGSRTCSGLGDVDDNVEWWKTTLIYEIWPRFYQDSNADGVGDLQGIIDRLDYIKDLGVETINLGPIYPSPDLDCGYDVSDYKNVNPILGTIDDFDRLIKKSHERDIKVILDVKPNHTSDQHEWFNKSINRIEPYTNYYKWENGTVTENGTKVPPNNWMSTWHNKKTSAWTWNDKRGQWYYHRFQTSEPDLNFDDTHVYYSFVSILHFWLNHGVDGFRILGVPHFQEDYKLRDEFDNQKRGRTFGLESNVELLGDFRVAINNWTKSNKSTSKLLLAGSYDTMNNSLSYYDNDGVIPLNHRFLDLIGNAGFNATEFKIHIEFWLSAISSTSVTNWPISNEDNWRVASKVGSEKLNAFHMISLLLPGQAITFYGDEIGMTNTPRSTDGPDNSPINSCASDDGKYFVKSPMQWNDTISAGFSSKASLQLPVNENYTNNNVMGQLSDPQSHLNVYKRLAELRKNPVFARGDLKIESVNDDNVIVLRRTLVDHPVYIVVINMGETTATVNMTHLYSDLNDNLDVIETSGWNETKRTVDRNELKLSPNAGIVLKSENKTKESSLPEIEGKIAEKGVIIEKENKTDYVNETTQTMEMSTKKDNTVSTELKGETLTSNSDETSASIEHSTSRLETATLGNDETSADIVPVIKSRIFDFETMTSSIIDEPSATIAPTTSRSETTTLGGEESSVSSVPPTLRSETTTSRISEETTGSIVTIISPTTLESEMTPSTINDESSTTVVPPDSFKPRSETTTLSSEETSTSSVPIIKSRMFDSETTTSSIIDELSAVIAPTTLQPEITTLDSEKSNVGIVPTTLRSETTTSSISDEASTIIATTTLTSETTTLNSEEESVGIASTTLGSEMTTLKMSDAPSTTIVPSELPKPLSSETTTLGNDETSADIVPVINSRTFDFETMTSSIIDEPSATIAPTTSRSETTTLGSEESSVSSVPPTLRSETTTSRISEETTGIIVTIIAPTTLESEMTPSTINDESSTTVVPPDSFKPRSETTTLSSEETSTSSVPIIKSRMFDLETESPGIILEPSDFIASTTLRSETTTLGSDETSVDIVPTTLRSSTDVPRVGLKLKIIFAILTFITLW